MQNEVVASRSNCTSGQRSDNEVGDNSFVLGGELYDAIDGELQMPRRLTSYVENARWRHVPSAEWAKDTQDLFGNRFMELTDLEVVSKG